MAFMNCLYYFALLLTQQLTTWSHTNLHSFIPKSNNGLLFNIMEIIIERKHRLGGKLLIESSTLSALYQFGSFTSVKFSHVSDQSSMLYCNCSCLMGRQRDRRLFSTPKIGNKSITFLLIYITYLPTYLPTYQCDQMIRLFFNICPLATKNSPKLYQIFQSRLNICQKLVKFCQSCLFSPNLVTLLPTYLPAYLT